MLTDTRGLHCKRPRISWLVVRGGTINSQIVKQEGEYTPRVPDTVTHVLLRTHRRRRRRGQRFLLEILSRNESNENDHKTLHFTTPRA